MEYLDYTNLAFSDKLSLLWTVDAHFSGNIIYILVIGIGLALVIYIFDVNFLFMIMPGGKVYGDSSTTSFPRWLPIMCLILITLLYTGYKMNNANFIITQFGKYSCEYKSELGLVIDEQFRWSSFLITFIVTFVYALWFRES